MEDANKIQEILKILNKGLKSPAWEPAKGFHAHVVANVKSVFGSENYEFDLGHAMIIKNFVNTKTGEVKSFYFKRVTK